LFQGLAWLTEFWNGLGSTIARTVAAFVASVIGFLLLYFVKKVAGVGRWAYKYFKRLDLARRAVDREPTSLGPREGKGLWVAEPIARPILIGDPHIVPPPILVVANAKGGVGKTTVSANLGACFAEMASANNAKPVLLIDLDFQGSLSSMSVPSRKWLANGRDSSATYLLSGDLDARSIVSSENATIKSNGKFIEVEKLKVLTAYQDLAQAENRLMIEWLLSDRSTDIRFRLLKTLSDDAVRDAFSLIIIDSPPRLTTGAIQGCSTLVIEVHIA
jgi:hypothetical protein